MKCPKCGYISFDYNQVCPKCNKNITSEQEKFYLPSFRPDPPSLLGFLIGDANESNVNLNAPSDSHMDVVHEADIGLDDSATLDPENLALDEQDFEIGFEPEDSGEYSLDQESVVEPEKLLLDSDFSLEEKGSDDIVMPSEPGEGEELSLDLGELSLEEPGGLFNELLLDDSDKALELVTEDSDFFDEEIEAEGSPLDISAIGEEKLPDLSDLMLEEAESGNKEKTMILNDFSLDDSDISEKEEAFDLSDISLHEPSVEDNAESTSEESLSESNEPDLDLDAMSLDVEDYQKESGPGDGDFVLDLEDLDIDLDLDESKK